MIKEIKKTEFKKKGCTISKNGKIYDEAMDLVDLEGILQALFKDSPFDLSFSATATNQLTEEEIMAQKAE